MEFSELNDHICADTWLIRSNEISKQRLVRKTPRYNIYKADYFGDALVYEPIGGNNFKRQSKRGPPRESRLNGDELSVRLSELNLNLNLNPNPNNWSSRDSQLSDASDDYVSEQTDSAYSSISSTPQYHTKNVKLEFQFPVKQSDCTSSSCLEIESSANIESETALEDNYTCAGERAHLSQVDDLSERRRKQYSSLPLVLNMGSYQIDTSSSNPDERTSTSQEASKKVDVSNQTIGSEQEGEAATSWLNELNELRLVAHESFMLFMGFSLMNENNMFQTTSLVMEHPKATSLYNLLHATCFSRKNSPSDRFFSTTRASPGFGISGQQRTLNLAAKLNICQQVTNAMTYLHDKNIVHGRLTSVNIYIELNQRVKISLIDNDERSIVTRDSDSPASIKFNLAALTYLSPELIKTININKPGEPWNGTNEPLIDTTELSKKSDIFSFGTILFELFEERFPFGKPFKPSNQSPCPQTLFSNNSPLGFAANSWPQIQNDNINLSASELIYLIGSGQLAARNLDCHTNDSARDYRLTLVNRIISACWLRDPTERPDFRQLSFVDSSNY